MATSDRVRIAMAEWQQRTPADDPTLTGAFIESPADAFAVTTINDSKMLRIDELRSGLRITSSSFVGRVQLGNIEITVQPKLNGMPLMRLLRYAIGLPSLRVFSDTSYITEVTPFQDLLIHQLVTEANQILRRGVRREYQEKAENLSSPRGRFDLSGLARSGGQISSALPCRHYPRVTDCLPNQILLAGLQSSARCTQDLALRAKARLAASLLDEQVTAIDISPSTWNAWRRYDSRLIKAYRPAIELVRLITSGQGITLGSESRRVTLPGFLFDMNRFFQCLVTRLLSENLDGCHVRPEHRLNDVFAYIPGWNPCRRRQPTPRPDIAIERQGDVVRLLDAKYRDLWEHALPRDMLYQLSIYALSRRTDRQAVILYATLHEDASEAQIEVRDPFNGARRAKVVLRPLNLRRLDSILFSKSAGLELAAMARSLVFGSSGGEC